MNSLFGCDFRTSAGRCTIGIYMNFVTYKNKKIVIMDTEGLMSVESGNALFDNQLATMAVLSSHMIIVNHKGEISSNLERLLGITFYAKLQTSKSMFKPSIVFVLRDQMDRNKSSVATQASKLKAKLMEQASKIAASIDDVMSIDVESITLLSNAFAEGKCPVTDREKKWRNNIFPSQITELRALILQKLEKMDKTGHSFNSLSAFYTSMRSYWKTLEDLGFGILNCKDLEEIKMRNEISTKCTSLVEQYGGMFCECCQRIIQNGQKDLEKNYTDEDFDETIFKINDSYKEFLRKILDEFEKQIDLSYFPEELKREYRTRIEQNLERIKYVSVLSFKNFSSHIKEVKQLENIRNDMVKIVSDSIKLGLIEDRLEETLQKKFDLYDTKYENILKNSYNDDLVKRIQNCYNQYHEQLIFTSKFKHFQTLPKMDDLEEYINGSKKSNPKSWFEDSSILMNLKVKFMLDKNEVTNSIKYFVERCIIPKVLEQIEKPFVEDSHIRNAFEILKDQLFNLSSPVAEYEKYLKVNNIIFDVLRDTFKEMYLKYKKIQILEIKANKSKYDSMKNKLMMEINNSIKNMKNSKNCGQTTAEHLIENLKDFATRDCLSRISTAFNSLMIETWKNPEELEKHAFSTSFLAADYVNVFRYVTDIKGYLISVCEKLTENKVKLIIENEIIVYEKNISEFINVFRDLDFAMNGVMLYEFIDLIIDSNCNSQSQEDFLLRVKPRMINLKILNIDHFKKSFRETIFKKIKECQEDIKNVDHIRKSAKYERVLKCMESIGCVSRCPGCGSKCHLQTAHTGSHKSFRHILNGFKGWHIKSTKAVCTNYCWQKDFYLNPVVDSDDKEYESFECYVKEKQPEWLDDIKGNYVNYSGGTNDMKNFEELNYFMNKCWMNVRLPLIKRYELVDKKYTPDWLTLEDKEKMLKEEFAFKI